MGTISVSNLGKAYKQYPSRWSRLAEWLTPGHKPRHTLKWVLRDVSFTVNAGEAVGIVGVNGAGKSTLLKMITGTTQPTTGSVQVSGRVAALLELGMGFHPDFTGRQNVYMAGQLLGYSTDEITDLIPEIESFASIGASFDQPLRIYSSGMQSRLAFALATAKQPDILIVDEALSVGDVYFQSKCYERISGYKKNGMTLLLVSHAVMDVAKQCNRAIFLKDNTVYRDGSAREVANAYMDCLFGSSNRYESILAETTGNLPNDFLSEEFSERYHQRPGYRSDEHRWGRGGAKILDYVLKSGGRAYPSEITTNDAIEIYFSVAFLEDFEHITPGLLIKTVEGIFVYGTNSYISTRGTINLSGQKGRVIIYKFQFRAALNQGHYLLSLGVSGGDPSQTTEAIDRRYDSILINVVNPVHMWGMVDFQAKFEVCDELL